MLINDVTGMPIIKRYFTTELEDNKDKSVYDLFKWKKVDVFLKDYKSGKILLNMKGLEFPENYSQNACNIIASKYFRKAGVPNTDHEISMKQVAHRMVNFWTEALYQEKLITSEEEKQIFYDEAVYGLLNQMYAPNSPQWFNTGLALSYGIKGSAQGHYYFDEKKHRIVKSKDNYTRTQSSACFILSVNDSLLGPHSLSEQIVTETKLFKGGSGTGSNFSSIRAEGEKLSGGGVSSGLMSFLKVFDKNAGAIKSGGTVRRAAKLVCLDEDHPEIMDFIKWKSKEEKKVKALGKMGYDTGIDGEAYETVSGQNANNSVRFSDDFMNKVVKHPDAEIELKGRVDSSINRKIKVKELWDAFVQAIYDCGDPAPQFGDTFNKWHTCPAGSDGKVGAKYNMINGSNPCHPSYERLLTTNGYIPIGKLEGKTVGVVNADGDVSLGKVWYSGIKEIYEIRLANKKTIHCTQKQIYQTTDGSKCEAQNLKGKRLMPYLNSNYKRDKEIELIGFIQGDGNLTKLDRNSGSRLGALIGQKDGDILNYFNEFFDKNRNPNTKSILYYTNISKKSLRQVGFSNKHLPERELPTTLDCWSYIERTSFLRGLYSANGSVLSNGKITLKSTCYNLVYDLWCLLTDIDIDSYITTNRAHMVHFSNGDYLCKESYDLNIGRYSERVKFYNKIGFIQQYKMDRLRKLLIEQSPKVGLVINTHKKEKVYDFSEPLTHWGVVEGFVAHNCGEYAFLDDSSCNLASINVYKFYDPEEKTFNATAYKHLIHICQLILEASIYWGQYPTMAIAKNTYNFRATGLGISNLASLLMAMGIPYDSDEGRIIASGLTGILTGESYYTSALMAKEVGAFAKYDINKYYMSEVILNHKSSIESYYISSVKEKGLNSLDNYDINNDSIKSLLEISEKENPEEKTKFSFLTEAIKSFKKAIESGDLYGYRNAQVTVLAPTGTISFAMDCGSTSIEPFFSHKVYKKLVGGGTMSIANPVIEIALKTLGYNKDEIKDILNHIEKTGRIEDAPHMKEKDLPVFDTASACDGGKRYIDPMGHVNMMAVLTPTISGSISKTVNLPNSATVKDINDIVISSWKLGIKGITLYRDGCKATQPLNNSMDKDNHITDLKDLSYKELLDAAYKMRDEKESIEKLKSDNCNCNHGSCSCKKEEKSLKPVRKRMTGIRKGTTHPAIIDGVKIYTTVNRREDGSIGEIYITTDREGTIIMGLLNSLSKAISVMLQYGIEAKDISKLLRGQKFEPYGFVQNHPYIKSVESISDLVSKIIDIELGDFSRCQIKPNKNNRVYDTSNIGKTIKAEMKNGNLIIPEGDSSHPDDSSKMSKAPDKIINQGKDLNSGERVYGKTCPNCSSTKMIKNGTCYVCQECGTTTGCS